jgi:hypothetical protein
LLFSQQNQQGQVQYAPYQPMQYLPQQAPLEFIQHQQQHPQRPLQLMTLQPQTSAPAPSNHTVPPQQHQLAQPISTTSS